MRRLIGLKASHQTRTQQPTESIPPPSPEIHIHSQNAYNNMHNTPAEPTVTYHTNFLGLFAENEGDTPIATTLDPKLTDFVPPVDVRDYDSDVGHSEDLLSDPRGPRQIEDFDYVGGWRVDQYGNQQYVAGGRIEEVEDEGAIAGPSRLRDAMSLPATTTPPPRPLLRTRRELSQSPLVPESYHRFQAQHPRLSDITRNTPARFASPLSMSGASLPLLRGFSQHTHDGQLFSGELSPLPLPSDNAAQPLAASSSNYIIPEEATFLPTGDAPLTDSLASLPPLRGLPNFPAYPERISEENLIPEPLSFLSEEIDIAFEDLGNSLGNSLESLPPKPQEPMITRAPEVSQRPILTPLQRPTEDDERIIEQNITAIKEISQMVETIRSHVSGLRHLRNVEPHLERCNDISESLSRVQQTLIRRRTLPQEHWFHMSSSSRSRYENRLLSLQRCLRRLSDMSKRLVEPGKLDLLFNKLGQHYEKLTNVADKLDDTFERLKLRHLYTVASKLTEEANKNRTTYMSAREMYVHKKRGKMPRARRRYPGMASH